MTSIKFIRFDFSEYERRKVPEELTIIREKITGLQRNNMEFWALDKIHCETADIIKESNFYDHEKIFVANVELADYITKYFPIDKRQNVIASVQIFENNKFIKQKFIYDHYDLLYEYGKSIKEVTNENELQIFEKYYDEDYDSLSLNCNIIPYYPEIITSKQ